MTEPSEDPIKTLWRDQQEEEAIMTAKAIRALARNHGDHVRDRLLFGYAVIAFEVVVFGWYALKAPNALMRAGELLVLAGLAWMTWRMRLRRPGRLPNADASAQTLIAFHRTELQRQRSGYVWALVSAGPMIAGLLVMVAGMKMARPDAPNARFAPIFVLFAVWFVALGVMQRRGSRRIQRQIEDLDALTGR